MPDFSPQQQTFINTLSRDTGLNSGVVAAWVAAEEPVGAASGYRGTQDWLNVGITDSGPMGAGNAVWQDPQKAAQATAGWIKGTWTDPGFGNASSGIRAIAGTAGQSPQAQINAIQHSGWASSGYPDLPSLFGTYGSYRAPASVPSLNTASQPRTSGGSATPKTSITTSGGQPDYTAAGIAALMAGANRPINSSGKVTTDNVIGRLLGNVQSGLFNTPTTTTRTTTPGAHPPIGPAPLHHFAGYLNPITGATIGRTDMGLDASGLPNGHPIRALGDSKVIGISSNWYAGQPYVLFQLTSGPQAGKYYYIAEAINPTVQPGQTVRAGDVVGTYNSGGTGLELGWGSPVPGRTLAQAQGNTGDAYHNNAPAGIDFTKFFKTLR